MSLISSRKVLLSIIIPSFNQIEELNGALGSINSQSFRNFEVIVVDGGSENAIEIEGVIEKFSHLNIYFKSESDQGIYDAMNKGIDISVGEYLYFMGCDDRLASPDILNQVFNQRDNLRYDFLYGNVVFTSNNSVYDGQFGKLKLISRNICHQAIFVRRELFQKLGKFDLRYKYLADWVFNMKCFNDSSIKKSHLKLLIALYNNDGASFSNHDYNFIEDKNKLNKLFFPLLIRYIHSYCGSTFRFLEDYI
jgi:glycosyltransferase involved in cell wall biosynthesis